MQTQHQQQSVKNNQSQISASNFDEVALQKLQGWRTKCKEFLENALEMIIQSRGASFNNSNPHLQLKQFGMSIENQNDIRQLLSAFGSLTPSMTEQLMQHNETERPLFQDVFLDVIYTNRIGSVLSERWKFSLSLSSQTKRMQGQSSAVEQGKQSYPGYYKRLCVLLRTIRSLQLSLPSHNMISRLTKIAKNQLLRSPDQEVIKDILNDIKTEYEMKYDSEMLVNEFNEKSQIINHKISAIKNIFGELSVEVYYIKQNDIVDNFKVMKQQKVENQGLTKNNPFQQLLMNALGPQQQNQLAPQSQLPQVSQINNQKSPNMLGIIKDQQRFRANSDNTFNQHLNQRALKQQYLNARVNLNSPGPSDGLMIREDYFNNEKQKLFYQISNKQSGNSFSSGLSNKSSELLKQGTPPFIPQINYQPTTQGSSSILKSSLEGGNNLFGNFDSHDFNSNRPSRPKIEPFKKFDNLQSARTRNYRLSFDEGQKPLQSQRSLTSLFAPSSIQNPTSFRKTSNIMDNLNSRIQQQIVEEDQNENQFDMIQNPFSGNKFDIAQSIEKLAVNQLNPNNSSSSLLANDLQKPNYHNNQSSPSSGNHQYLHALPRKNSTLNRNEQEQQLNSGRISFGPTANSGSGAGVIHGHHEPIKRISSCQDFMMLGGLNSLGLQVDPLFQIDEKKKYIGFLEESDEEQSQSDEFLSISSEEDEDEGVTSYMDILEKYQVKVQKELDIQLQESSSNNNNITENKNYQNEMRREFFHLLQIREIILDNNRHKIRQQKSFKQGMQQQQQQQQQINKKL